MSVEGLGKFVIFEGLGADDLKEIAHIAHIRAVEAGEELTTEGEEARQLYCFLKGKAAVKVRDE